jgi:transcriptional regulator with XRE-family HTH domain
MSGSSTNGVAYSIGEVFHLTGASPAVVRLWERDGLLRPRRTPGGHRVYSDDDIKRVRQISFLRRVEKLNTAAIRREIGPARSAAGSIGAELSPALGRRLRAFRTKRGLSLAEVAAKTGLSISFLSAVERAQSGISLGNLFKLADVYGTTVPGLQAGFRQAGSLLVRPAQRPRYVANYSRVLIEDLITRPGALEAQHIQIEPGGESEEAYTHPGEEFLYVIAGRLSVWLHEREHYDLQAGDALYFRSSQRHRWRNDSDTTAQVLWINVPRVQPPGRGSPMRHLARNRGNRDGH